MFKSSIIAIATLLASVAVASVAAEAKGGHHGGHHRHHHRGFGHGLYYSAPVYVAPAYSDCGYAYARWQATGSFGWKKRYYACRGWW